MINMSKFDKNILGNNLLKVDGHLEWHLAEKLKEKNITKYRLSKLSNIRYDTICYYCAGNVTLINAEYIKIFCYILDCKIQDIVQYIDD